MSNKTIGELNGVWALSLRIMLATYPLLVTALIAWSTWVTVNLVELRQWKAIGLQTTSDAKVMKLEITAERDLAIAAFRTSFDPVIDSARKANLDIQSKLQDQQFEIQRLQDRVGKK